MKTIVVAAATILSSLAGPATTAFAFQPSSSFSSAERRSTRSTSLQISRRDILTDTPSKLVSGAALLTTLSNPSSANADAAAIQDSLDTNEFLRTGIDSGGIMGVSSQAGKSRPQTGVVFRDGTDVLQGKSGDVSAELLTGTKAQPTAVLVSFNAPYKLETGSVFDVECRDGKTGDGAFLAVTESTNGKSLEELPSSFFLSRLFDPTGRFSFYGPPTDVKVKKSTILDGGNRRLIELTFSNLSQSTNAEIPRNALLVATIPNSTNNAIMLVVSSNANRWKKGAQTRALEIANSFNAIQAPKTNMKLRVKDRSGGSNLDF